VTSERRTRRATLWGIAALILVLAGGIVGTEPSAGKILFAGIAILPLCAFVPFLARGRRRSYAALTLCLAIYLPLTLMELIANPAARVWMSLALLASFALFALAIVYLRLTRSA
jgi:uncharacterized membrane protein